MNNVVMSSAMIHRSLLPVVKGFPESRGFRTHEDHALWLRVATLTDFIYLADPLIAYTADSADSVRIGVNWHLQRARVRIGFIFWAVRTGRPARFVFRAGMDLARQVLDFAIGPIRQRFGSVQPVRVERAPYIRIPDVLATDDQRRDGDEGPADIESRIREILPDVLDRLGLDPLVDAAVARPSTVHGRYAGRTPRVDNGTPDTASRVLTFAYCRGGGCLRLHDTQIKGGVRSAADSFTDLKPADNTLILFPSRVFHAVLPADRPSTGREDGPVMIIGRVRNATQSGPDRP